MSFQRNPSHSYFFFFSPGSQMDGSNESSNHDHEASDHSLTSSQLATKAHMECRIFCHSAFRPVAYILYSNHGYIIKLDTKYYLHKIVVDPSFQDTQQVHCGHSGDSRGAKRTGGGRKIGSSECQTTDRLWSCFLSNVAHTRRQCTLR